MTQLDRLVGIRAQEEITEHGGIDAAIQAVDRQIASPDSIAEERRYMRRVRGRLIHWQSVRLTAVQCDCEACR